jgi:modulator of FtsH protease HflK
VKVNVDEISTFSHSASMLTQDENIVDVELTVQSRIQDAADYLFQVEDPDQTLRDATVTVVRVTVGGSKLDFVMTEGRGAVAVTIRERIQELMDQYRTGLLVTSVNMQPAKPPEEVKAAFDDAIKAREDKERTGESGRGLRQRGPAAGPRRGGTHHRRRTRLSRSGHRKIRG